MYHPQDEYLSSDQYQDLLPDQAPVSTSAEAGEEQWPWAEVIHLNNDLRYIERFRKLSPHGKAQSSSTITERCSGLDPTTT